MPENLEAEQVTEMATEDSTPVTENESNLSAVSDDDLIAAINDDTPFPTDEVVEEEVATEDEPDAADDTPEESVEEEATEEAEPAVEQLPEDDRFAAMERTLEKRDLQDSLRDTETDKLRMQSDRNAGRLGSALQEIKHLRKDGGRKTTDDYSDVAEQPAPGNSEVDLLRERIAQLEQQDAGDHQALLVGEGQAWIQDNAQFFNGFKEKYGEEELGVLWNEMQTNVKATQEEMDDVLTGSNPRTVKRVARNLMTAGLTKARIAHMDRLETKAEEARTANKKDTKRRKQEAFVSGSGGANRPAPKKRLEDYSKDELGDLIDSE
jgi:hypothetical protein